jgi:hypothetical protein
VLDPKMPAEGGDLVQHFGQDEAVDDVPADFNIFHGTMLFGR